MSFITSLIYNPSFASAFTSKHISSSRSVYKHVNPQVLIHTSLRTEKAISSSSYRYFHGTAAPKQHRKIVSFTRPRPGKINRNMVSGPPESELERQYMTSSSTSERDPKNKKQIAIARPSSSILLISPTNQILLLHRIRNATSFPSAHVFPGGNLDAFHESPVPPPWSPRRHIDSDVYRRAAIRECFEESGILLAHPLQVPDQIPCADSPHQPSTTPEFLRMSEHVLSKARRQIHRKEKRFGDWVQEIGAVLDTAGLIPFTRWITPGNLPKRYTTQMYIYFLPMASSSSSSSSSSPPSADLPSHLASVLEREEREEREEKDEITHVPKHDGGLEHTAAEFAHCSTWLSLARRNEIILFPPQFYLLSLLDSLLPSPAPGGQFSHNELQEQRDGVVKFVQGEGEEESGKEEKWSDKIISPVGLGKRGDGRLVLGLAGRVPEFERRGSGGRAGNGDGDRILLVRFGREGPRDLEMEMACVGAREGWGVLGEGTGVKL